MRQRGYTLLELMLVVCIIGILSMVAMTEYNKIHNRAYVGAAINDVQLLRKALALFDAEWGSYPLVATASAQDLGLMLLDPMGEPYVDPPTDHNFEQFHYIPPRAGDEYGNYSMLVICKDHWRTQITVNPEQGLETVRLGN